MQVTGDVLSFNNVWRNQNFFYDITIALIQIIFIVVVINHHIQVARYVFDIWSRSGVEDTKFEAKDWKKIRGQNQGPAFQVQTLSRPRAELVEAKTSISLSFSW